MEMTNPEFIKWHKKNKAEWGERVTPEKHKKRRNNLKVSDKVGITLLVVAGVLLTAGLMLVGASAGEIVLIVGWGVVVVCLWASALSDTIDMRKWEKSGESKKPKNHCGSPGMY